MKTTKEMLEQLNVYRAREGKASIKAWKESRAKLEAAIAKLSSDGVPTEGVTVTGRSATESPNLQNIPIRTEEGRKIKDALVKAIKAPKAAKKVGKGNNPLSEYCKAHGINAKVARAKLRRAGLSSPYTQAQIIKHLS